MKNKLVEENPKFSVQDLREFKSELSAEKAETFEQIITLFLEYMDKFYDIEKFDHNYKMEIKYFKDYFDFICEKQRYQANSVTEFCEEVLK